MPVALSVGKRRRAPDIIHAAGYWLLDGETKPWQVQYDGVEARPAAEEVLSRPQHDELAKLRTLHEERQAGVAGEKRSPSGSSEKKVKEKKKKKKRKEKSKKAEKEQSVKKGQEMRMAVHC